MCQLFFNYLFCSIIPVFFFKKINARSWCLINDKINSNNDPIKDGRSFKFNNIKSLVLSNMNLSTIDNHAFTGFVNLKELIFNENKFTKIESNSFQHLKTLKWLYLRTNQIEQIS